LKDVGAGEIQTSTVNVTFANLTAGTQYATETHTICENPEIKLNISECHLTSELRIYSSSTHNGYVISSKLPGSIVSLAFNAGYKKDVLVVYGSNDGETWNVVRNVEMTSTSYLDYQVDFAGTSYTYFKLDVQGAEQIRLKTLGIEFEGN